MSYLARLKQQISPDASKCEPAKPSKAPSVGSVGSVSAPLQDISDDWREFEGVLVIVGRANQFSPDDFDLARTAARGNLADALMAYRDLARQTQAR